MTRMRGLIVTTSHTLALAQDIPLPEIGEYEALVKVECCAICNGTDSEILRGALPEAPHYPLILGHEGVGIVVAIGTRVQHLRIGDRVLRPYQKARTGPYYSAWGSFAEYGVVTDAEAMREDGALSGDHCGLTQQVVDARIDAHSASIMITLKEVYAALKRMNVKACQRVIVMGSGPVGLCMAQLLGLFSAARVAVLGRNDLTLAMAKDAGVEVFDTRCARDMARLEQAYAGKIDHYIDTVGTEATIGQGRSLLAEDGMIDVYGLHTPSQLCLPMGNQRSFGLRFVQWPTVASECAAHMPVEAAVLSGALRPAALITHILPLERYEEGFAAIREKRAAKVILTL